MSEWIAISPEEQRDIARQGTMLLNEFITETWRIIEQQMAIPPVWYGQRVEQS